MRLLKSVRGERIAIFVLGDSLRVVHDFSSDNASLLRKLNSAAGIGPLGRASGTPGRLSAAFSSEMRHRRMEGGAPRNFFQTGRILETFAALEAIANHVKGLPGRKNLLWVSAAFPLGVGNMGQLRTFGPEMERTARALNSSGIAVYPIDARGLFVGNPYVNVSTMKALAEETGGTAFYNRNDHIKQCAPRWTIHAMFTRSATRLRILAKTGRFTASGLRLPAGTSSYDTGEDIMLPKQPARISRRRSRLPWIRHSGLRWTYQRSD